MPYGWMVQKYCALGVAERLYEQIANFAFMIVTNGIPGFEKIAEKY
jgi:hypothetical protein